MNSVLTYILSSTNAKATGPEKWLAHCGAHGSKRHRDLSIRETNDRILLHCFAGCPLENICVALGIRSSDLFFDALDRDPQRRRIVLQQRDRTRLKAAAVRQRRGRRTDALREADYFVRSRQGLDISQWTIEKLDEELNVLADAYALLSSESHAD